LGIGLRQICGLLDGVGRDARPSPLVDNTCLVEAGDDGGDDQCHHDDRQAEQGGDPGDVNVLIAVDLLREPAREDFQPVLPAVGRTKPKGRKARRVLHRSRIRASSVHVGGR